jgi:hypothetical protein
MMNKASLMERDSPKTLRQDGEYAPATAGGLSQMVRDDATLGT